jgi:hypothetical protein
MGMEPTLREALDARPEAVALACMDTSSGLLLSLQIRGDVAADDVEMAALSAAELCAVPAPREEDGDTSCAESFLVSRRWVHAYARVPRRSELVMVGIARGGANVALLRAWLRRVAERVDQAT